MTPYVSSTCYTYNLSFPIPFFSLYTLYLSTYSLLSFHPLSSSLFLHPTSSIPSIFCYLHTYLPTYLPTHLPTYLPTYLPRYASNNRPMCRGASSSPELIVMIAPEGSTTSRIIIRSEGGGRGRKHQND